MHYTRSMGKADPLLQKCDELLANLSRLLSELDARLSPAFAAVSKMAGALREDSAWMEFAVLKTLDHANDQVTTARNLIQRQSPDPQQVANSSASLAGALATLLQLGALSRLTVLSKTVAEGQRQRKAFEKAAREAEDAAARAKAAQEAVESLRTAATVGAFAQFFEKEKESHEKDAKFWLWIAGAAFAVLLAAGVTLFFAGHARAFADLPGRLLIVTGVIWALAFASRNYRAAKHNAIRNRHRSLALQTMILFRDSAESTDVKDEVLRIAANAAFGGSDTGFGEAQSDGDTNVVQNFVEGIRGKPG